MGILGTSHEFHPMSLYKVLTTTAALHAEAKARRNRNTELLIAAIDLEALCQPHLIKSHNTSVKEAL